MSDVANSMDESTRRYYLDAMGIQCWQLIDSPDVLVEDVNASTPAIENKLTLSSLENTIQYCNKCQLHKTRKQAIVGRGNASAELMFVLLSPDAIDDQTEMICSGEANVLLKKMLAAISVAIDDVYITSLLKCAVSVKHTVSTTELHHCNDYLQQQVALMQPKIVIVLGETATQCVLQNNLPLDDLRVSINVDNENNLFEETPLFVSYSPVELIEQPENKRKAWSDLQKIQKIIQG